MSYADKVFKGMCRDILDNGVSTEGEKVRPVWEDTNESAYTIKKFGVVNRYDLRKVFLMVENRFFIWWANCGQNSLIYPVLTFFLLLPT